MNKTQILVSRAQAGRARRASGDVLRRGCGDRSLGAGRAGLRLHNALLDLEHIDDEQFERYRRSYARLAAAARRKLERGELDTDSPEVKDLKLGRAPSATAS
jgi:hypothetical protein